MSPQRNRTLKNKVKLSIVIDEETELTGCDDASPVSKKTDVNNQTKSAEFKKDTMANQLN